MKTSKLNTRMEAFNQQNHSVIRESHKLPSNDNDSLEDKLTNFLLYQTLSALRIIVNDEINELDFVLRCVASEFLKPKTGILVAIVQSVR